MIYGMKRGLVSMVVMVMLASVGCAGGSSAPAAPEVAPPAGSPLARVEIGMTDEQVVTVLGPADHSNNYMTGKAFIPFNFGAGDTSRSDWLYKGQGRVVFTRNQWSGRLSVIKVLYDPSVLQ